MNKIKVSNMTSSKSYNKVANQFLITTPEGIYFQSYQSTIAFRANNGEITLDKSAWDYSRTTGKYRNQWLGEGIADTRKKIANQIYQLSDLN